MPTQDIYTMTIHSKGTAVGHLTVELTGPDIENGRRVNGFHPQRGKEPLSKTTLEVKGMVRNDAGQLTEFSDKYLSSETISLTRDQAMRAQAYIESIKDNAPNYDANDRNCVDFANGVVKAAGLPGDVDDYLTTEQRNQLSGAVAYNMFVYGGRNRTDQTPFRTRREDIGFTLKEALNDSGKSAPGDGYLDSVVRTVEQIFGHQIGWLDSALVTPMQAGEILARVVERQQKKPGQQPPVQRFHILNEFARGVKAYTGKTPTSKNPRSFTPNLPGDDSLTNYRDWGINHTVEDGNYIGPGHEFSPEDAMTPEELRAQLARNTAILNARTSRNLLDDAFSLSVPDEPFTGVGDIVISGIPEGAHLSAGTSNVSRDKALHDRLTSTLGNRDNANAIWQGTARERASMPDYHSRATQALDYIDDILNDGSNGLAHSKPQNMSTPASPGFAGLFMDKPTVERVMRSNAYQKRTDPNHGFATGAVRGFFGATYADNNFADNTDRQTALEEPSRASAWVEVQKNIDRDRARQQHEARKVEKAQAAHEEREHAAFMKAAEREERGMPKLDGARTVGAHNVDRLDKNAMSSAVQPTGSAIQTASKERHGLSPERIAAAARQRQSPVSLVGRDNDSGDAGDGNAAQGRVSQNDERTGGWNLFGGGAESTGGPVTNPDRDQPLSPSGTYRDEYGREIGAYGQFTRDIMGRGDGSAEAGNTRVICTELVRQGLMDAKLQRVDIAFTLKHLSPVTVGGYHFWAVPYVEWMKRSRLATCLIEPFARWRAEEIAHQMGERAKPHWRGKLVRLIGEPLCWFVGWLKSRNLG